MILSLMMKTQFKRSRKLKISKTRKKTVKTIQ